MYVVNVNQRGFSESDGIIKSLLEKSELKKHRYLIRFWHDIMQQYGTLQMPSVDSLHTMMILDMTRST